MHGVLRSALRWVMTPFSTTDAVLELFTIGSLIFPALYVCSLVLQFSFGCFRVVGGRIQSGTGWQHWAWGSYVWFVMTIVAYGLILSFTRFRVHDYSLGWLLALLTTDWAWGAVLILVNLLGKSALCFPSRRAEWLLLTASVGATVAGFALLWREQCGLFAVLALLGGAVLGFASGLSFLRMQRFVAQSDADGKHPNRR